MDLTPRKREQETPRSETKNLGEPLLVTYFTQVLLYPDGTQKYLKGWCTTKNENKYKKPRQKPPTFSINKEEDIEL